MPARRINEIVHGKRAITADIALRLGRFFPAGNATMRAACASQQAARNLAPLDPRYSSLLHLPAAMRRCLNATMSGLLLIACNARKSPPDHLAAAQISVSAQATAVSPETAAPSAVPQREVPFDGGVAQVRAGSDGADHVLLLGPDGGVKAESTCVQPYQGYDAVRSFFERIRTEILAGDTDAFASSIAVPLRVNAAGTRSITSREQFLKERGRILTSGVLEAVRVADPGQVFCNSQGVMLGDGVMWATVQPDNRLAVSVINIETAPRLKGHAAAR